MKKLYIIIMLLVFSVAARSGPEKFTQIDKKIIHHIFNAEWNQADSLIEAQIKKQPDHPKYYFFKAPLYFYTRYFSGSAFSNDSLMQLVVDNAQKAIDLGEKMEKTTEIKFYLGSANGFLSRIQIIRREFWDGYWSARDSRNYLEEVLEEDPNFYDAYLGLGVLEYYPAVNLNGFLGAIAWLAGMAGDREKGLEYFQKVLDKGKLCKDEAAFILSMMYRFQENDPQQAYSFLNNLQTKFPNNNFISAQYRQAHLTQLIDENGAEFMEAEFDSLQTKYNINNSFTLNGTGYFLINQNRLDDALAVFKVNLKLYPEVANCYDSLAECYMIRGNNKMAIKYYKMAYEKLPQDQTINEDFRERLKTGIEDRLEELGES